MQKSLFIFLLFLTTFSYSQNEKGVVINGVTWATCNVGAIYLEEYGDYFTWEEAKTACPEGWRVPTREELQTLLDKEKVTSKWTIGGRRFTDIATGNSIFLSAAGCRHYNDSEFYDVGTGGYYWSSTEFSNSEVYLLYFHHGYAFLLNSPRQFGFSVRCVKE